MTPTDAARVTERLTKEQREMLLRYEPTLDPQPIPTAEFMNNGCELFVSLAPAEYEDGCLIVPEDRAWLAGMSATGRPGASDWQCTFAYSELGLAIREFLQSRSREKPE